MWIHTILLLQILSKTNIIRQISKCRYHSNIKTKTQDTKTGNIAIPTHETNARNTISKPIPLYITFNETAANSVFAPPCETLQKNCKREQGHCRTVLQVQGQVQGHCRTEQGLHRRVQGVPRTLQSRPQKSSSQRPCLQKISKLSQINFKLRLNEAGNVDVIATNRDESTCRAWSQDIQQRELRKIHKYKNQNTEIQNKIYPAWSRTIRQRGWRKVRCGKQCRRGLARQT